MIYTAIPISMIVFLESSKEGKLAVIHEVGRIIHKYRGAPMPMLIKRLNQTLRGWGNYHRWVVSSRAFRDVDKYVFDQLWRLMKRRHSNKPGKWVYKRYWTSAKGHRTFSVKHLVRTILLNMQKLILKLAQRQSD
jgi:RNA-directed DNA polymerase